MQGMLYLKPLYNFIFHFSFFDIFWMSFLDILPVVDILDRGIWEGKLVRKYG